MTTTAHLIPQHDAIQQVQVSPNWSENLLFTVNDGKTGVSVWAHWSRIPAEPELWEAVLAIYLPSGELLVHRSFGSSHHQDAASSGPLTFRCVQPLQRWEVAFDGMVRRTTSDELAAGPLADGPWEPARFEAEFEGVSPTWSAGGMDSQEWADGHLEQPGRIRGSVTLGERRFPIDAAGFRDHSYGPRDYSRIIGDTWLTGVFPSGRSVLALLVWTDSPEVPALTVGFVDDNHGRHAVTGLVLPRLADRGGSPHSFVAEVTTETTTARITVEQTHCATYTFDSPVGMTLGARHGSGDIVATEGPARLTWDGEVADGWIEKTLRPSEFGR